MYCKVNGNFKEFKWLYFPPLKIHSHSIPIENFNSESWVNKYLIEITISEQCSIFYIAFIWKKRKGQKITNVRDLDEGFKLSQEKFQISKLLIHISAPMDFLP